MIFCDTVSHVFLYIKPTIANAKSNATMDGIILSAIAPKNQNQRNQYTDTQTNAPTITIDNDDNKALIAINLRSCRRICLYIKKYNDNNTIITTTISKANSNLLTLRYAHPRVKQSKELLHNVSIRVSSRISLNPSKFGL